MNQLTLGYLTLNAPPADTIDAAIAAGFTSVGIRITGRRIGDAFTPVLGNPAAIRDLRARASDHGVRLSTITAYHLFPDVTWDYLQSIVDTTAALGSKAIVTISYLPEEARFIDLFSRYCRYAAERGVTILLEFTRYSAIKSIEAAQRLIGVCAQPNSGLVIDPVHLFRSGGSVAKVAAVDPARLILFQLCDADRLSTPMTDDELIAEARLGRLAPGDGEIPLYDLLDALPEQIEIEYEVPRPEHVGLPMDQRARIASEVFHRYIAQYQEARRTGVRAR